MIWIKALSRSGVHPRGKDIWSGGRVARMQGFLGKFDARIDRMTCVAGTLGGDLIAAVGERRLDVATFREAVFICAACGRTGPCSRWLEVHADTGAAQAPFFCPNAATFERVAHID